MKADDRNTPVALFQKREIRRTMRDGEWWFVITDVIAALTDSADPSGYWKKMRKRDPDIGKALEGGDKLSPPCPGVCDGRRAAENAVLEHRRRLPADPIRRPVLRCHGEPFSRGDAGIAETKNFFLRVLRGSA